MMSQLSLLPAWADVEPGYGAAVEPGPAFLGARRRKFCCMSIRVLENPAKLVQKPSARPAGLRLLHPQAIPQYLRSWG